MDIMSLVVGFLFGTATGAAGTYFGNKYTDIRKTKESKWLKNYFIGNFGVSTRSNSLK